MIPPLKILLSNDDGFHAPGLQVLRESLSSIADIRVVAPKSNCSGLSNSLSLRQSIQVENYDDEVYIVHGTPADCVHLAVNGMLDFAPDLVVSGVNNGENMGDDAMYSGTIAGAFEGRHLRLPSLAVSLASIELKNYPTAARVVLDLLNLINNNKFGVPCILSVNVPDIAYDDLKGMEITRCGTRHPSFPIITESTEGDLNSFRIGLPGEPNDTALGTDFYAISQNRVSITPLSSDMTYYDRMDDMRNCLT